VKEEVGEAGSDAGKIKL